MKKIPAADNWKHPPGGFDALNTYWIPELQDSMPLLRKYEGEVPRRLIRYGTDRRRFNPDDCVHFFIDDYRFEPVWRYPERVAQSLSGRLVCSPDFSLYMDWPAEVQRWNIYRSRWCGALWAKHGAYVIPTVSWACRKSFDFAFSGLQGGGVVAIATIGVPDRDSAFIEGFDAMIERVNPSAVLCYGHFSKAYGKSNSIVVNYPYKFGPVSEEGRNDE